MERISISTVQVGTASIIVLLCLSSTFTSDESYFPGNRAIRPLLNLAKKKKKAAYNPRNGFDGRKAIKDILNRYQYKFKDNPQMADMVKNYRHMIKDKISGRRRKENLGNKKEIDSDAKEKDGWDDKDWEKAADEFNQKFENEDNRLRKLREEWKNEKHKDMLVSKARTLAALEGKQPGLGIERRMKELGLKATEAMENFVKQQQQPTSDKTTIKKRKQGISQESAYCYEDATGVVRGPYSIKVLRKWRNRLPMDLPMRRFRKTTNTTEENKLVMYADVIGDGLLLEHWRQMNIDKTTEEAGYCNAPTPANYETEIEFADSVSGDCSSEVSVDSIEEINRTNQTFIFESLSTTEGEKMAAKHIRENLDIVEDDGIPSGSSNETRYIRLRCIHPNGVAFRLSPNITDVADWEQHGFIDEGMIFHAVERLNNSSDGSEFVRLSNGYWVPMVINGTQVFEESTGIVLHRTARNAPSAISKYDSDAEEDHRSDVQRLHDEAVTVLQNPDVRSIILARTGKVGYFYDPGLCGGININPNKTKDDLDRYDGLQGPFYPWELTKLRGEARMDMPVYFYDGKTIFTNATLNFADVVGDSQLLRMYREEMADSGKKGRGYHKSIMSKPTALEYWETLFHRLMPKKENRYLSPTYNELRSFNSQENEGGMDISLPPRNPIVPAKMPVFKVGEKVLVHEIDIPLLSSCRGSIGEITGGINYRGRYEVSLNDGDDVVLLRPDQLRVLPTDMRLSLKAEEYGKLKAMEEQGKQKLFQLLPALYRDPKNDFLRQTAQELRENILFFRRKSEVQAPDSQLRRLAAPKNATLLSFRQKLLKFEDAKGELASGWEMHVDDISDMVYYRRPSTNQFLRDRPVGMRSLVEAMDNTNTYTARKRNIEKEQRRSLKKAARLAAGKGGSETGDTTENEWQDDSWLVNKTEWKPLIWSECREGVKVRFDVNKRTLDKKNVMKNVEGTIIGIWRYGESASPKGQEYIEPSAEILVEWQGGKVRVHPIDVLLVNSRYNLEDEEEDKSVSQRKIEANLDMIAEKARKMQKMGFKNVEENIVALSKNAGDIERAVGTLMEDLNRDKTADDAGIGEDNHFYKEFDKEYGEGGERRMQLGSVHPKGWDGSGTASLLRMDLSDTALAAERAGGRTSGFIADSQSLFQAYGGGHSASEDR